MGIRWIDSLTVVKMEDGGVWVGEEAALDVMGKEREMERGAKEEGTQGVCVVFFFFSWQRVDFVKQGAAH
jgi:hypothetical protein